MNIDILNSLTLPIMLALAGFLIGFVAQTMNRRWQTKDRVAEKRLEIYERIGEDLNRIYCYIMDVGDFKDDTPDSIVAAKRRVQKQMNIYRALWPDRTLAALHDYMNSGFKTFQGPGVPARVRASTFEKKAAFEQLNLPWDPAWDARFIDDFGDIEEHKAEHRRLYEYLQRLLSRDLMFEERPFWRRDKF
jgi:hypothetical protein